MNGINMDGGFINGNWIIACLMLLAMVNSVSADIIGYVTIENYASCNDADPDMDDDWYDCNMDPANSDCNPVGSQHQEFTCGYSTASALDACKCIYGSEVEVSVNTYVISPRNCPIWTCETNSADQCNQNPKIVSVNLEYTGTPVSGKISLNPNDWDSSYWHCFWWDDQFLKSQQAAPTNPFEISITDAGTLAPGSHELKMSLEDMECDGTSYPSKEWHATEVEIQVLYV
ncbi:MAG: hypothetical protein ABIH11_05545 [Candidatus Altiarchaeota archaeon]